MTGAPLVLTERLGAVRLVSLNRPDRLNALDAALTRALLAALKEAAADPTARAVLLTGEGRAFCAGADTGEMAALTPANEALIAERAALTRDVHALLAAMPKPVVAAARGAAVGGGAGLAIACDMVVAGSDLRFGYPELRHGLVPALVMTGLQRHLGAKRAFELVSLGALLGAEEALALGLVNRVVEPDAVRGAALEIAEAWAAAPAEAMAATKALFRRVADLPYADALDAGREVNIAMRGFRR